MLILNFLSNKIFSKYVILKFFNYTNVNNKFQNVFKLISLLIVYNVKGISLSIYQNKLRLVIMRIARICICTHWCDFLIDLKCYFVIKQLNVALLILMLEFNNLTIRNYLDFLNII